MLVRYQDKDLSEPCEAVYVVKWDIVRNFSKVILVFFMKEFWNLMCCVAPAKYQCVTWHVKTQTKVDL